VFFSDQTPAAIRSAINAFEQHSTRISADACRANALRFSPALFRDRFASYVNEAFEDSRGGRRDSRTC
jgi:hypothetical protein